MPENIAAIIVIGVLEGGIYGLLAMGLSLQYGVCRVLNITHGEFAMLGAVLTYSLSKGFGINPLLTVVIIGPLLFGIGFLLQATLFRGLKARAPAPAAFEGNALLAAFGLMYIIEYVAYTRWGNTQMESHYLSDKVPFFGIDIDLYKSQLVAFAVAVALGIGVHLFLTRSRLGRAIRATAEDPATAGLMGVNTNMILGFCFGLGALLAGIAGTMISIKTTFISTAIGFNNTVIALIVVVLGGLGSIPGSFIAGILIGIVSMLVLRLWEPILTVPVYYVILMVLLLARPAGILGKK